MLSHFPAENQNNFTTIYLEDIYTDFVSKVAVEELLECYSEINYQFQYTICEHMLNTKGFKTLMKQANDGIKYDLIFFDIAHGPCLWPVKTLFGSPPSIATSSFGISVPYVSRRFGLSSEIATNPFYTLPYSKEMTFFERVVNLFTHLYDIYLEYHYWGKIRQIHLQYFGTNVPHYSEYERNFSLLFANYNPILDFSKSIPPTVIPLGGLHLRKKSVLPLDLKSFMDQCETGIIVVSFGTVIQANTMKEELIEMFINAFSKLKETVIWKFESKITNLSSNIKLVNYLPLMAMLGHPNVKAFIGHGGALSTQEMMYFGIPFIGMPIFLDQHSITAKIVYRKAGLRLNYYNLSMSHILETIQEVIENPIYKMNAQRIAHRYRTFVEQPENKVIHYTDQIIRGGDMTWLRPIEADTSMFHRYLLDVWLVILLLTGLFAFFVYQVGVKIIGWLKKNSLQIFFAKFFKYKTQ